MLAAEIRHRAAGDGSFLLPPGGSVKGAGIRGQASGIRNCLILDACYLIFCTLELAGVEGLEPPTPGFGDRCSSH
jgi:hypothetical protein